jgi:hypothetical protein
MTSTPRITLSSVFACLLAVAAFASAQTVDFLTGESPGGPAIIGVPYSGTGTTTVKLILFDGTRIERSVTAKFYRDSAGRIRREQTIMGLEALNPSSDSEKVIMIVDSVAGVFYTLSPGGLAYRMPTDRRSLAGQPPPPPPPPPPTRPGGGVPNPGAAPSPGNWLYTPPSPARGVEESLGTRQIEGLTATGRKITSTIAVGQIGNDRPIEITDEKWESVDLRVVLFARHHDPRTGDIEYRLANISRTEPSPDLFTVPPGYTFIDAPPPPPPPPAPPKRGGY